jgi:hypothetical protein
MGCQLSDVVHDGGMITLRDHEISGARHEKIDDIEECASRVWIMGPHRRGQLPIGIGDSGNSSETSSLVDSRHQCLSRLWGAEVVVEMIYRIRAEQRIQQHSLCIQVDGLCVRLVVPSEHL